MRDCPHALYLRTVLACNNNGGDNNNNSKSSYQPALTRLGLTQEIGSAREEGTILLHGPAIVPILWNDFTKSNIQTSRKKS